jgi:four helix bundle protein
MPGRKPDWLGYFSIPRSFQKLPSEEKYNLVSQIKRAGLSITNNLAEGASRKSKAEKNRFFEVARSSLVEIDNCMIVCIELHYLTEGDIGEVT